MTQYLPTEHFQERCACTLQCLAITGYHTPQCAPQRQSGNAQTQRTTHYQHRARYAWQALQQSNQLRKSKRRGVGVWVQSMPLHGHHHGGIIWGTSGRPLSCSAGPNPGLSGPLPGLLMPDPERARQGPEYPVCSRKRPEKRPDWHPEWTAAQTRNSLALSRQSTQAQQ